MYEKCDELLESFPADYVEDDYLEKINGMGGLGVPLNILSMPGAGATDKALKALLVA